VDKTYPSSQFRRLSVRELDDVAEESRAEKAVRVGAIQMLVDSLNWVPPPAPPFVIRVRHKEALYRTRLHLK